jgi:hypothetical protein
MGGLVDQAGGPAPAAADDLARARQAWEASMLQALERLRPAIQQHSPERLAMLSRSVWSAGRIHLNYWGRPVTVELPAQRASYPDTGQPVPTFDLAMLLFYLSTADGVGFAGRWIGYRELPGGLFYHQAFQGYTGERLARAFGETPQAFERVALALGAEPLPGVGEWAFAVDPLPAIRLAAILWPGDDEFPARASILFDAAAPHFLPTDGLALLGAGLTSRLLKSASAPPTASA